MSNEYQKEQDTKMFDTPAVMDDSNSMFRTIMEKRWVETKDNTPATHDGTGLMARTGSKS